MPIVPIAVPVLGRCIQSRSAFCFVPRYVSESLFAETFTETLQRALTSTETFGSQLEQTELASGRTFPGDNYLAVQLEEVSKGFDIILDRFSRLSQPPTVAHTVHCALLGGHAYWMLSGACDPIV